MDLATATPAEIDGRLADLYATGAKAQQTIDAALETLHDAVGDRRPSRRTRYKLTHEQAVATAHDWIDNSKGVHHERERMQRAIDRLAAAEQQLVETNAQTQVLDAEYDRRPWSRFIAVEGGHLHSGRVCEGGTIRVTTKLGWHPELSGKTEAEAVDLLGPMLCTHCFRSAPVEFTVGTPAAKANPNRCTGTGQFPVEGTTRFRMNRVGECPACHTEQIVKDDLRMRAHNKPKGR